MAQEEQTQKCSNSSSGTCGGGGENVVKSHKKQKVKKIPQRGLGVAQLERIRLEEQQKRDGVGGTIVLPSTTIPSTLSSTRSSSLSVPITPNYPPSNQSSSSSIPFPPADHIPALNLIFRPSSSSSSSSLLQNNEVLHSNSSTTVPLTNPLGWSSTVPIHQGHYNLENGIARLDPGIAFRSNLNSSLPYESIPIWPLPGLMHRAHQYQQPSAMVNVSSTTPSSSVLNFHQMEPPSNQSHYGNYIPMWPEDEKMVGMKRACPYSLDNPPTFSPLHCKFPPTVLPLSRSDDSTSCSSGRTLNSEPCYPIYREGSNSKRNIKEKGGGFLSLASPTTISPMCQTSKFSHPPPSLPFNNSEFSNFDSLPYQGRVDDPLFQPGPGRSNHRQPYYSFFPQAMARTGQVTSTANNFNGGEVGHDQGVDLNLKL